MSQTKGVAKIFLIAIITVTVTSAKETPLQHLTSASSAFAHSVYKQIGLNYDNLVFSPYSIHSVLSMTSMGATGKTLEEIRTALHLTDLPDVDVREAYKGLIGHLNNATHVNVLSGNGIFLNPSFNTTDEFKNNVTMYYDGIVQKLNFSALAGPEAMVNEWVEGKTNDMIKDLLKLKSLTEARTKLVLVNTLFFNGSWVTPFPKEQTKETDFHVSVKKTVKVDMMHVKGSYKMKFEEDANVLRLPFIGDSFALYIVLPNNTVDVINPKCLGENSGSYFTGLQNTNAVVYLPKFEINFQKNLVNVLQVLGMKKAFTSSAELSKIGPNSIITSVIHQAVIKVLESGTTAAAATAVIISRTAQRPNNLTEFRVDRPFLFYLRDDTNDEILFQGKFTHPQSNPGEFSNEVERKEPHCDGTDSASTLQLNVIAWIICITYSSYVLRRVWN